jgi:hypothetical protein
MCDSEFEGNERTMYCSELCRAQARRRSVEENRRRRRIQNRKLASKKCIVCGTILSIYGVGNTCDAHTDPKVLRKILKDIREKA